jgi:hypothetical protein
MDFWNNGKRSVEVLEHGSVGLVNHPITPSLHPSITPLYLWPCKI